jgi:hypothetical protein
VEGASARTGRTAAGRARFEEAIVHCIDIDIDIDFDLGPGRARAP